MGRKNTRGELPPSLGLSLRRHIAGVFRGAFPAPAAPFIRAARGALPIRINLASGRIIISTTATAGTRPRASDSLLAAVDDGGGL